MNGEKELFNYLLKSGKEEKQRLLKASEISLMLDTYDDIFSDFDPRPFSNRALSDDFLAEAKRASKEKSSGEIELKFLIRKEKRDVQIEMTIKKRLHEHFKKHFIQTQKEINSIINRGYLMIFLGIIIMVGTAFVTFNKTNIFANHLLIILLEPAGWFTFWTGLDQIFYETKRVKPDADFYAKMMNVEIEFIPY